MFYERLKQICKARGTNITKVCTELKLSSSSTSNWKSGKRPNYASLKKLAEYLNVSVDFLISDEPTGELRGKGVKIPVVGVVRAGIPAEAVEDIIGFEEISAELAAGGDYVALRVKGDSMEPRICAGDIVIVRRQPTAESGDVCVVMIGGDEATLKKIQRTDEGIILIPFNPAYQTMFFSNRQIEQLPVLILGKVIENRQKF